MNPAHVILFGILLSAGRAFAESPEAQAEALIRQGVELRQMGKDEEAYPFFQKAYEVAPAARTAAQLGLVEMQLRRWVSAERHLSDGLASPRDPWVSRHRAELETSLARVKTAIGEVVVVGGPPGAEVYLNGTFAGRLPLNERLRTGEGQNRLEVRAPGHEPFVRTVVVPGGRLQEVAVSLERARMAGGLGPLPRGRDITDVDQPVNDGVSGGGFSQLTRPLAWTASAAAAGAVAFAAYETARWNRKSAEFNTFVANPSTLSGTPARRDCGVDEPNRGAAGCAALYEEVSRAKTRAVVGYIAGGLLAGGAAALFLISGTGHSEGRMAAACRPTLAWPGGWCRIAF